ncbi:MAG: hypothetical protein J5825_04470 [Lachnospiraceae bacterium]|nr:hypothetical protein [Lachnospiraceae bacterium]
MQDDTISDYRLIHSADVQVFGLEEVAGMDLTIIGGSSFFMDEVQSEEPIYIGENGNPESGIVVSERCFSLNEAISLIGKKISFEYEGEVYTIPVTSVISDEAESRIDPSFQSACYLLSDNILASENIQMVILRMKSPESVLRYLKDHQSGRIKIRSAESEIRRHISLSRMVSVLLGVTGVIFSLFSATGIVNGLQINYLQNRRNRALLQVLGFSSKLIICIDLLGAFDLWVHTVIISGILIIILGLGARILQRNIQTQLIGEMISPDPIIVVFCFLALCGLVIACTWYTSRHQWKEQTLDVLKSE